jgi:hypothetical protein
MIFKKWKIANKKTVSKILEILEEIKTKGLKEAFPLFKEQVLYVCFRACEYTGKDWPTEKANNQRRTNLKAKVQSQIESVDKVLEFLELFPETGNRHLWKLVGDHRQGLKEVEENKYKGWAFAGLIFNGKTNRQGKSRGPEKPAEVSLRLHLVYHFQNFTAQQEFKISGLSPTNRQWFKLFTGVYPTPPEKTYRIPVEGQTMPDYGDPCYSQVEEISDLFFPANAEGRDDSTIRKQVLRYKRKHIRLTAWELPF